jgi:hypothetical protein
MFFAISFIYYIAFMLKYKKFFKNFGRNSEFFGEIYIHIVILGNKFYDK